MIFLIDTETLSFNVPGSTGPHIKHVKTRNTETMFKQLTRTFHSMYALNYFHLIQSKPSQFTI